MLQLKASCTLKQKKCQILSFEWPFILALNLKYTHTCVQRPPLGPQISGRCLKVTLCYKMSTWDLRLVAVIGRWSLFGGGC